MSGTDTAQERPQSPPPQQQASHPERTTVGDLRRGDAEKAVTDRTESVLLSRGGGPELGNLRDTIEAARLLSAAGAFIPPHLQGNVGGVFFSLIKAHELGVSALALMNWSYVVEQWVNGQKVQRIAYESQFFHAIIEAHAPITTRLQVAYEGSGGKRRCRVWATFKGEKEPRYFPPLDADPDQFTLDKLHPGHNDKGRVKGSQLWDTKPDLQLFYNMSRDWARMHAPDILAGLYGKDEMEDAGFTVASETAKDVSPGLSSRLRGNAAALGQAAIAAIDQHAAENAPRARASSKSDASAEHSIADTGSDFPGDRPLKSDGE